MVCGHFSRHNRQIPIARQRREVLLPALTYDCLAGFLPAVRLQLSLSNGPDRSHMKNLLQILKGITGVLGRIMLCAVFIAAVLGYAAPDVRGLAELVAAKGIVGPTWAFVGGVLLLVVGSLSVIVGYKARMGASLLLVFLLATTCWFHGFNFWTVVSPHARHEQVLYLVTNLSIMGAVLFIIVNGPGPMSVDAKR